MIPSAASLAGNEASIPKNRNWAEIDQSALRNNLKILRQSARSSRIMAVVKADAYGHGIQTVVPVCAEEGVTDYGVASLSEALDVRALLSSHGAIYLLSPALPEDAPALVEANITPLISDLGLAQAISRAAAHRGVRFGIHLEVDTGIGRSGFPVSGLPEILELLDSMEGLVVTGLASHFASADEDADDMAVQDDLFRGVLRDLGPRAFALTLHTDNSPAALTRRRRRSLREESTFWMIRPGLLLYGIEPAPGFFGTDQDGYRPALTLRARVALCRRLEAGASISYGRTFRVADGGGIFATIPVGYGDGYARALSNRGSVLLHGHRAPICGRVCMDQFVVDVSRIPGVQTGDVATLIGADGALSITAGELAALGGLTPHELTTCLTARVPRFVLNS